MRLIAVAYLGLFAGSGFAAEMQEANSLSRTPRASPSTASNPSLQLAEDHQDLGYYLDEFGRRREIRSPDDWRIRRRHIRKHLERVMGKLPGASMRTPLDVQVLEESRDGGMVRRKISYQSDPFDRVTAWLRVFGMVNTAPGFNRTPPVINGFSDLILELYGPKVGAHARSAVGQAELPFDIAVEIEAEVEIALP